MTCTGNKKERANEIFLHLLEFYHVLHGKQERRAMRFQVKNPKQFKKIMHLNET